MKVSEITVEDIADFLRLEEDYNKKLLEAIRIAAREYIINYTGLTLEEVDLHEEFYIALMVLCQDMHDNRAMYIDKANVNKVVNSILWIHSKNLL